MKKEQNILYNRIKNYKVVSFDLFDTLLFRIVDNPTNMFYYIEVEYNKRHQDRKIDYFRSKRINAESQARKQFDREITIDEIYTFIDYDKCTSTELELIEKELEIGFCIPNESMIAFLEDCQKRGQTVAITTDMYLDRKTICSILDKLGICYDYLFVSSEIEGTKRSGLLFARVLEILNINKDEIVHIGDNEISDVENAKLKGINAFLYSDNKDEVVPYFGNKYKLAAENLKSFINHSYFVESNEALMIGYSVLGPLIYSFCEWLNNYVIQNDIDKIYFVAREGYLVKQIYDAMYPEDCNKTRYIVLNRNLLRLPSLHINPTSAQFRSTIPNKKKYSLRQICDLLAIKEDLEEPIISFLHENRLECHDFNNEYIDIMDKSFDVMFDWLLQYNHQNAEEQYNLLLQYLKKLDFVGKKIALVNNSYNGTAQLILENILAQSDISYKITGIQFVASNKCKNFLGTRFVSWLDELQINEYSKYFFFKYSIVFEHLLFANEGTAMRFKCAGDKIDVIKEEIGEENKNFSVVSMIQDGALLFAKKFKAVKYVDCSYVAIDGFIKFLLKPSIEDASIVGQIIDKDFNGIETLIDTNKLTGKRVDRKIKLLFDFKSNKWLHGMLSILKGGIFVLNSINVFYKSKFLIKKIISNAIKNKVSGLQSRG